MLAVLAAITIVTGILALRERGKGGEKGQPRINEKQAKRLREDMLQLVWNTWIEDVLKTGLYFENRIALDLETRPDAIEHPYDLLLSIEGRKPQPVPSDRPMLEHLDSATGALLILGEPGSGKSTLLLELACQAIQHAQADAEQPDPGGVQALLLDACAEPGGVAGGRDAPEVPVLDRHQPPVGGERGAAACWTGWTR